jgi:H+/Cl- antiporter ClcA
MAQTNIDVKKMPDWQPRVLVIGAVIGAVVGLAGAYLFVQQAEKAGNQPKMTPGDGVRLGLLVLGLLRQVAALGD